MSEPSRLNAIATSLRELRDSAEVRKRDFWNNCHKAMYLTKVVDNLDKAMNAVIAAKEGLLETKEVE